MQRMPNFSRTSNISRLAPWVAKNQVYAFELQAACEYLCTLECTRLLVRLDILQATTGDSG
jgi:hypothetical protein